jgi:hypothetical protein
MENTTLASSKSMKALYKIAAAAAVLIVLAGLIDAATSMGAEVRDNRSFDILELFTLFQSSPFEAFSRLGVINILTLSLGVPVYLALNQAFRKERPALAAFAALLFFLGSAVYLSSNTVFSLFAVSRQYAVASAAQKPLLEAAGRALLAQGADLTPSTFFGLIFTQIAGLLITGAMLRQPMFGKWMGGVGLAGFCLMSIFFIMTAFVPAYYDTALLISAPGGLLLMAYQVMLAHKLYRLDP